MPFSRYQIRNEFSLADPELYKSADKDDPEALLEGVAMAGLVGVLRQLGDLAEFAAEIFHGLNEEVMVTAARGHGLLVRVQQVESDFPSIERAFLSQTGHSAFFSSSGISWHPNLQTEQNLITKGDLPRFVMDSYEESRGPPRLFLLDKFDVAGAGACLKRYTDPSFYKVEASSYEMMSAEAQRDRKIRKTKKKGSRMKNGETPDVFQPSHVKLHQLLLEERVQNGASEPARRVKLKKREIKFPFDTENGKGYMEKLLRTPPEDKLVHEVPVGYSELESLEDRMVNSPTQIGSSYESPTVDKTVFREHMDHVPENSSIELQPDDIEDKHISVDVEQKEVGFEDGYRSDDVASETENYMDALTTMESEVETDVELRVAISDPIIKQEIEPIQSQFSDSQSASDDESSPVMNKIMSLSYSDTPSTSPENMSPHGISSPAFASTEIPFRSRVSPNEVSDNCIEARYNESLPVDNGPIIKESSLNESDSSEILSTNCVDVNSPTRKEEIEIDLEDIIASIVDDENDNSNSSLEISHDVLDGKSEPAEANVAYSSEDETKLKDRETVSFTLQESKVATTDDEQELMVIEPESVSSIAKDSIPISVPEDDDRNGIQDISTCEDTESKGREIETIGVEKNEDNGRSTTEEQGENGSGMNESGAGLNTIVDIQPVNHVLIDQLNAQILENDPDSPVSADVKGSKCSESDDQYVEIKSKNQVDQIDKLETHVDQLETEDSQNHLVNTHSDSDPIDRESYSLEQIGKFQDHEEPSMADLSQPSTDINRSAFNMIPQLAPSNVEKMPPLPPLPPMQWRMEKLQSNSLFSNPEGCQHDIISQFPPASLDLNENATNENSEHDVKDLSSEEDENLVLSLPGGGQQGIHQFTSASQDQNDTITDQISEHNYDNMNTEEDGKLDVPTEMNAVIFEEKIVPQLPQNDSKTDEKLKHDYQDLSTEEDGKLDVPTEINVLKFEEKIVPQPPQNDNKTVEKSEHDYEDLSTGGNGKLDVPMEVDAVKFEEKIVPQPPQNDNKIDEKSENDYEDLSTEENKKLDVPMEVDAVKFEEKIVPQPPKNDNKTDEKSHHDYEDFNTEEDGELDVPMEVNAFEETTVPQPPQNDNITDYEDLNIEEDGKLDVATEVNVLKFEEKIVPQLPQYREQFENVFNSEREIIRPLSTSVLPLIDNEKPNGIRPMRIQRPRSPLIDAVAAHDKSKLKKASERTMPPVPKEEERDTLLEQIRAKSFNLKPAVQTRPSIQGPSTNLRVAAILEKANAIRQAFAGSDDDEDDSDSWSDS